MATWGAEDTNRRQKTIRIEQVEQSGWTLPTNSGRSVPASYKMYAMLIIWFSGVGHHYMDANINNLNKT